MRKHGRTDANQREIVKALRKAGCSVAITSSLGAGFPDILCGRMGRNYLIEIKDGKKIPSQRKLTPDEREFFDTWRGHYCVVESVDDALKAVGLSKS